MPYLKKKAGQRWKAKKHAQGRRKQDNRSFYNSKEWRQTSKNYRQHYPLCELCEKNGMITAATCVDHIIPVNQGGDKFSKSNLQSLCNHCHAVKSGREAHDKGGH